MVFPFGIDGPQVVVFTEQKHAHGIHPGQHGMVHVVIAVEAIAAE